MIFWFSIAIVLEFIYSAPFRNSCIDVGIMNEVVGCTYQDFSAQSDAEGRVYAGGNSYLSSSYSIGAKLTPPSVKCGYETLVVGKKLIWEGGRNYYGNIIVGDPSSLVFQYISVEGCDVIVDPQYFNFSCLQDVMIARSEKFRNLDPTAKYSIDEGGNLKLQFSGAPLEVINVDDTNFFSKSVRYVPPFAWTNRDGGIIFNLAGTDVKLFSFDMSAFANVLVIYNYYEATKLEIGEISVKGYVLAPYANVNTESGNIYGSIYATNFSGPLQLNDPVTTFNLCNHNYWETRDFRST